MSYAIAARMRSVIGDDRKDVQGAAGIVSAVQPVEEKTAIVVGGGVAGMSAACALAEAGLRVKLVERRGYLGRAGELVPASGRG